MNTLLMILRYAVSIYGSVLLLRFLAQWLGANTQNPIVRGIIAATDPILKLPRRFLPKSRNFDWAALLAFALLLLAFVLLVFFVFIQPQLANNPAAANINLWQVILLNWFYMLAFNVLNMYFFIILIVAITSWVNPSGYNPVSEFFNVIINPFLAPLRRVIPPLGGVLDITPMLLMIVIIVLQNWLG